jgi:hypothetical protein
MPVLNVSGVLGHLKKALKLAKCRDIPLLSNTDSENLQWLSYPAFATVICGIVVFCVQTENLKAYNVTPIIGIAISAFGNQIITTVMVTYAVDCHHEHAASIGVFINLVRSTWGFIGTSPIPFFSCGFAPLSRFVIRYEA